MHIILQKMLLGISLAMPIGPVCAEMIKRGLARGFWAAFNIRLGGVVANSLCLLISYFGFTYLFRTPKILQAVTILGALLLLYMGLNTIRNHVLKERKIDTQNSQEGNGFLLGFVLALTSPVGILFWLGEGGHQEHLFIQSFILIGVLIWGGAFSLFLHYGGKKLSSTGIRIVSAISGSFLIYAGARSLILLV